MTRSGLDLLSLKCYEDMELGCGIRACPSWEGGWAGARDRNIKADSTEGYAEDSGQGNKNATSDCDLQPWENRSRDPWRSTECMVVHHKERFRKYGEGRGGAPIASEPAKFTWSLLAWESSFRRDGAENTGEDVSAWRGVSDEEGEAQERASRSSNLTAANSEMGQWLNRSKIKASARLRDTPACL